MDIIANLLKLGNAEKARQKISENLKKDGLTICGFYEKPKVQLYNGIEQIAEMIGAEIKTTDRSDYKEKSFVLDGVEYLQITSSLDGGFAKLDEVKKNEDN